MDNQTAQLLLTNKQVARLLQISERKLWDMTQAGEIPFVRINRSVRYSAQSIQQWLKAIETTGCDQ